MIARTKPAQLVSAQSSPEPLAIRYVDLCEESPPEGMTPVHWRLLTTLPVETAADALDVAARDANCWRIEELFRTMKCKSFDIEDLQITDNAPRRRLILACFIAATVVMQMVAERDGPDLRPLTDALNANDQLLLEEVSPHTPDPTAPLLPTPEPHRTTMDGNAPIRHSQSLLSNAKAVC